MDSESLRNLLGANADLFDRDLFSIAGTTITAATIATFIVILLLSLVVSFIAQRIAGRAMRLARIQREGSIAVARRLVHYATMFVGTCVALQTIGIELSALFAAGAIFAIGIGFAMRNLAENFFSGVILLLEGTIKPGDVLEVESTVCRVERLGIRAAIVRTRDDEEIIVPNTTLVQNSVINYTLRDSNYRLKAPVGVHYDSDLRVARESLERAASSITWRSEAREPLVLLRGFGDSSVDYEVSVWVDDPFRAMRLLSELNEAIWWSLKESGITIAFPQLDLHVDKPLLRALGAGS